MQVVKMVGCLRETLPGVHILFDNLTNAQQIQILSNTLIDNLPAISIGLHTHVYFNKKGRFTKNLPLAKKRFNSDRLYRF